MCVFECIFPSKNISKYVLVRLFYLFIFAPNAYAKYTRVLGDKHGHWNVLHSIATCAPNLYAHALFQEVAMHFTRNQCVKFHVLC